MVNTGFGLDMVQIQDCFCFCGCLFITEAYFAVKRKGLGSHSLVGGCRGCDRMGVGFTTTYAISAYYH
jgi:hypothetical protein